MFRAMLVFVLLLGSAVPAAEEFTVEGTVNAVNFKEQKLNITHGVITGLPGETTREFAVLDPGMLEEVQAGNKIRFKFSQESDGVLVITDFDVVTVPAPKPLPKKR